MSEISIYVYDETIKEYVHKCTRIALYRDVFSGGITYFPEKDDVHEMFYSDLSEEEFLDTPAMDFEEFWPKYIDHLCNISNTDNTIEEYLDTMNRYMND